MLGQGHAPRCGKSAKLHLVTRTSGFLLRAGSGVRSEVELTGYCRRGANICSVPRYPSLPNGSATRTYRDGRTGHVCREGDIIQSTSPRRVWRIEA